jgi:DNA-binding CsgD family transcriptional regulator
MSEALRPIERRILTMQREGLDSIEIGRRFNRSPEHIDRVAQWSNLPGRKEPRRRSGLRPVEQRVVDLRAEGISYEEIGGRFQKGPDHIRRVERFAQLRSELGLA